MKSRLSVLSVFIAMREDDGIATARRGETATNASRGGGEGAEMDGAKAFASLLSKTGRARSA
jgi:hypothetical protein